MGNSVTKIQNKQKRLQLLNNMTYFKIDKKTSETIILIVDDLDVNFKLLKEYLLLLGFKEDNILYSSNGKNAIETVNNNSNIDIIFMDIRMIPMNGYKTTEEIRKNGYVKYVIGITGMADIESIHMGLKAGMNKVFTKPINIKEIIKLFRTINILEIKDLNYIEPYN